MNHFLSFPSSFFPIVSASIFTPFLAVAIDIGAKSNLYFPIGYRKVCKKSARLYRHYPLKNKPRKRLCFLSQILRKFFSPPLAPYQINPLSLQSDEVLKQAIGKDYLHGINRFHHFEFPTFSYWRSNCWPSFFCSKTTLNTYAYVYFIEKPQPHLHQRLLA